MLSFRVMKTTLGIMEEYAMPSPHALCYTTTPPPSPHLHPGYFLTLLIRPPALTLTPFNLFPREGLNLSYQNKSPSCPSLLKSLNDF